MPPARSRTTQALFAVGLVSTVCATIGAYLYYSTNTASVPYLRRRRKIMISSSSVQDVLGFLPADAVDVDDIYVTLLCENNEYDRTIEEVQGKSSYLVRHEKGAGLTHIARHISPDMVIILPDIVSEIAVNEIKDWVGQVVVVGDSASLESSSKVKHVSSGTRFEHLAQV